MDDEHEEPRRDRGLLPGVFGIPLVPFRGQTEPVWVTGLIIASPLIVLIVIAIARLTFQF